MKRSLLHLSLLCMGSLALVFSSCSNDAAKTEASTFSLDSAKTAIAASNKAYGECFATGDSAKFVGCYTSDACLNPPNMPRLCGPQAITAFFNGGYQQGIRNIVLTTEEVTGGKDAVVEVGKYDLLADKGVSIDKGKFIVIWKEENGKWKMHRDIFNSDMPMPTMAAPPQPKK